MIRLHWNEKLLVCLNKSYIYFNVNIHDRTGNFDTFRENRYVDIIGTITLHHSAKFVSRLGLNPIFLLFSFPTQFIIIYEYEYV